MISYSEKGEESVTFYYFVKQIYDIENDDKYT